LKRALQTLAVAILFACNLQGCAGLPTKSDSSSNDHTFALRYEAARWVVIYVFAGSSEDGPEAPVVCVAGSHIDMLVLKQLAAEHAPIVTVDQTEPRRVMDRPADDGAIILSTEPPSITGERATVYVSLMHSNIAGRTYLVEFANFATGWKIVRVVLDSIT
jgi:hypothetical protein